MQASGINSLAAVASAMVLPNPPLQAYIKNAPGLR